MIDMIEKSEGRAPESQLARLVCRIRD